MSDQDKSEEQLCSELEELHSRLAAWERAAAGGRAGEAGGRVRPGPLQAGSCPPDGEPHFLEVQQVARLGYYVFDIVRGRWTSSCVLDEIFGIPAAFERTLLSWTELIHPDDRQSMLDYVLQDVIAAGKPFEPSTVSFVPATSGCVGFRPGPLDIDATGRPVAMLGTIQDVTERKLAEEALQKAHDELERRVAQRTAELLRANAELRAVHDNMVDGLLIAECATGRFLCTNPAICRMLGYTQEQLLAMSVADIHPADIVPAILEKFRTQQEGQHWSRKTVPCCGAAATCFMPTSATPASPIRGGPA